MQQQQQQAPAAHADAAHVLQLLSAALSHDQGAQKAAEQALASLEGQPGYVSCLAVGLGSDLGPRAPRQRLQPIRMCFHAAPRLNGTLPGRRRSSPSPMPTTARAGWPPFS